MCGRPQDNDDFLKELDFSARPGTKTYPRWKDALLGCFKKGRYPHLAKSQKKSQGLNVYTLTLARMPPAVHTAVRAAEEAHDERKRVQRQRKQAKENAGRGHAGAEGEQQVGAPEVAGNVQKGNDESAAAREGGNPQPENGSSRATKDLSRGE